MPGKRAKKSAPTVGESVDSALGDGKATLDDVVALVRNHHAVLKHNIEKGLIHLPPVENTVEGK